MGSFHLEEGYYFQGFCKYDSRFYVILYHPDSAEKDWGFGNSLLAVVDFSTENLRILRKIKNVTYYDPYFYKDKIKMYENDELEDVDVDEDDGDDGKTDTYQYDILGDEEPDYSREEYNEDDYTVDGYCYYAEIGKEVRIFRQNLKSQREEEIFRYQTKHPGKTRYVSLAMDEEDMFICEKVKIKEENGWEHDKYFLYTVPRWGGKMKLVADEMEQDTDCVYNSKYIFWTDKLNQVHRWNRRTQKEDKVIKTKMYSGYLDLSCTEEGLYIQKANSRIIHLYYMEADGDEFRLIQYMVNYEEEYCEGGWGYWGYYAFR